MNKKYLPMIIEAVNLAYQSAMEMQLAERLKIALILDYLRCLISETSQRQSNINCEARCILHLRHLPVMEPMCLFVLNFPVMSCLWLFQFSLDWYWIESQTTNYEHCSIWNRCIHFKRCHFFNVIVCIFLFCISSTLTHLAHYILPRNSSIDPNMFVPLRIPASFDQMLSYLPG